MRIEDEGIFSLGARRAAAIPRAKVAVRLAELLLLVLEARDAAARGNACANMAATVL